MSDIRETAKPGPTGAWDFNPMPPYFHERDPRLHVFCSAFEQLGAAEVEPERMVDAFRRAHDVAESVATRTQDAARCVDRIMGEIRDIEEGRDEGFINSLGQWVRGRWRG
jgi:hypothetical protein